jgi:tyrosinase
MTPVNGIVKGHAAALTLSADSVKAHLESETQASLIAFVSLPRPTDASPNRDFDVIVGAPADQTHVSPESPYYAGMIAFFGGMNHMPGMPEDATFLVPLPKRKEVFSGLTAEARSVEVTIRVVPSGGGASVLKAATVRAL